MKLTARKLELYDMLGKGEAANAISSAVTLATKFAIRKIGRKYNEDRAVMFVSQGIVQYVDPVCSVYKRYGACDTESRSAIRSEISNRIAKRYCLCNWENYDLYYRI